MATCSVNWLEHFNAPPSLAFRQGWNTFGGRGSKNGRVTLSRLDERGHDAFLKVAWRSRVPWSTTLSRDTFYLNKRTPPPSPWFKKAGQKSAFTVCSPRVKTFKRVLPLAEEILTPARTLFTGEITLGGEGRPVLDSERASCIIACTQPAYNDTRPPFLLLQPRSLWLCHLSNLYDEKALADSIFSSSKFQYFLKLLSL